MSREIQNCLAVIATERPALAALEAAREAFLAPVLAAADAQFSAALREGRERLARAESALLNAMLGGSLVKVCGHGIRVELKRDSQRTIEPGALLDFAGRKRRAEALACLTVGFGKAAKSFGEAALEPITVSVPKGAPKLAIAEVDGDA
jgi:hypothetical protein